MRKYLPVLQEVGICLLFVLVAVLVNAFLFKDLFFKELSVPGANEYASIDQNKYKVVGDIQDAQNATQTYEASSSQIEDFLTESRYTPGTINPFVSSSSENDLPSETVGSNEETEEEQQ